MAAGKHVRSAADFNKAKCVDNEWHVKEFVETIASLKLEDKLTKIHEEYVRTSEKCHTNIADMSTLEKRIASLEREVQELDVGQNNSASEVQRLKNELRNLPQQLFKMKEKFAKQVEKRSVLTKMFLNVVNEAIARTARTRQICLKVYRETQENEQKMSENVREAAKIINGASNSAVDALVQQNALMQQNALTVLTAGTASSTAGLHSVTDHRIPVAVDSHPVAKPNLKGKKRKLVQ